MIREVCSCSAEIETDEDNALDIVKAWRKNHKHEFPTPSTPSFFDMASTHDIAPGFQPPTYFEDD